MRSAVAAIIVIFSVNVISFSRWWREERKETENAQGKTRSILFCNILGISIVLPISILIVCNPRERPGPHLLPMRETRCKRRNGDLFVGAVAVLNAIVILP